MVHPSLGKLLLVLLVFPSFFALGHAAHAQVFPALYVVTGVAANDTLNVRAMPDGDSADIGDLAPEQLTEVLELDETGKWAKIIWQERNGWVAMRYLTASGNATDIPQNLHCGGTEPFWGLDITHSDVLDFNPMNGDAAQQILEFAGYSANTGVSEFGFASADFTGFVRRAECGDGMSDRDYGWAISLIDARDDGFAAYSGCCTMVTDP